MAGESLPLAPATALNCHCDPELVSGAAISNQRPAVSSATPSSGDTPQRPKKLINKQHQNANFVPQPQKN